MAASGDCEGQPCGEINLPFVTWFSGGLGNPGVTVGLDDLRLENTSS